MERDGLAVLCVVAALVMGTLAGCGEAEEERPTVTVGGPGAQQDGSGGPAELAGTYVCLTGILGQVRPSGPFDIEPIPIPESATEPPLKFVLRPDGTYSNITWGKAYEGNPLYEGTFTVEGDVVSLFTPKGTLLTTYPFLHRSDANGREYLLEDAPENKRYSAYACGRTSS